MTEHYAGHDPETGCGLMVIAGLAIVALIGIVALVLLVTSRP